MIGTFADRRQESSAVSVTSGFEKQKHFEQILEFNLSPSNCQVGYIEHVKVVKVNLICKKIDFFFSRQSGISFQLNK
jgi:hypothetical protein